MSEDTPQGEATTELSNAIAKKITGWNATKVAVFVGVVIATVVPYVNPSAILDQKAMEESVDTVLAVRVQHVEEDAKAAVDKVDAAVARLEDRMAHDLDGMKESVKDKVAALREAVVGLKDLIQEKLKGVAMLAGNNRVACDKLENAITELEHRVDNLEDVTDTMMGINMFAGVDPYAEEMEEELEFEELPE